MKLSKIIPRLSAVVLAVAASVSANAGYVVLDGWELVTPGGGGGATDTKPIGRLNLVSGTSTVEQEINGSGNAFVGALFSESGLIFSISYTAENVVGAGDFGLPIGLPDDLTIEFKNVAGHVSALNGTGFKYVFDSGTFSIAGLGGPYANGSIVGIGGNTAATAIIGGVNGDSTLLGNVLMSVPGFDLKDNLGISLLPKLATGEVLFEAVTNNNVTSGVGNAPPPTFGACSFAPKFGIDKCQTFSVASAGDAYLVKVPEPGSLALVGLALVGVASLTRRNSKKA